MAISLSLYDTMHRESRVFVPRDSALVRIYSCGPTVYGVQHIGNMRYTFYVDFLKSIIRELGGYQVKHVMNITDVGHLTDDGDQGEDKMEKGAKRDGLTARDVAQKYTDLFMQDIHWLDADHFDVMPKATDHIPQQITMVKQLMDAGLTYEIPGDGIYCDTSKVTDYGKLLPAGHLEGIQEGARIDAEGKHHPTDFALWKYSPADEVRAMEWLFDGPRAGELLNDQLRGELTDEEQATRGFPGWHIECSAMSYAHLGEEIDIHTGGIEHIPIHHTNEIVQSECSSCHTPRVNYRFHLQHLQLEGEKISKSLGNVIYISDIQERGFSAGDLRLYFLQAHYRSFQDFTWKGLEAAKTMRTNLIKKLADRLCQEDIDQLAQQSHGLRWTEATSALADDLDTPRWASMLSKAVDGDKQDMLDLLELDQRVTRIGLLAGMCALREHCNVEAPSDIHVFAEQRLAAKLAKNREEADRLRNQIEEKGWIIKDTPDGYELQPL